MTPESTKTGAIMLPVEAPRMPGAADRIPTTRGPGRTWNLVRLTRPRQWGKNLLVLAAPVAAGVLHRPGELTAASVAFVAFTLAGAGVYCVNDVRDAPVDRIHPAKHRRPVAAGEVSARAATTLGIVLGVGGVAVSALLAEPALVAIVGGYVALTTAYTFLLKRFAFLDIMAIAAGFVLRLVAGAVAVSVPVSTWFLIVGSFGSLLMVSGKRFGEQVRLGPDALAVRRSLAVYSRSYLLSLRTVFVAGTVIAYVLWAFEKGSLAAGGFPFFELSIVPFAIGVLRYGMLVEQGRAVEPEEVVLGDRGLQAAGALWLALVVLGVYILHPPMT